MKAMKSDFYSEMRREEVLGKLKNRELRVQIEGKEAEDLRFGPLTNPFDANCYMLHKNNASCSLR
jgi:hypothetical protein